MQQTVHLTDFNGRIGLLSGVWFHSFEIQDRYNEDRFDNCQHLYIMLDGHIYVVREDPDDGYRSYLRDIQVNDSLMPVNVWTPPEEVMGRHVTIEGDRHDVRDEDTYQCDIIELVSTTTHKVVVEFGTSNTGDYYPYFVARFHPQHMSLNEAQANLLGDV